MTIIIICIRYVDTFVFVSRASTAPRSREPHLQRTIRDAGWSELRLKLWRKWEPHALTVSLERTPPNRRIAKSDWTGTPSPQSWRSHSFERSYRRQPCGTTRPARWSRRKYSDRERKGLTFPHPLGNQTKYEAYKFVYDIRYRKEGNNTYGQYQDRLLQRI